MEIAGGLRRMKIEHHQPSSSSSHEKKVLGGGNDDDQKHALLNTKQGSHMASFVSMYTCGIYANVSFWGGAIHSLTCRAAHNKQCLRLSR